MTVGSSPPSAATDRYGDYTIVIPPHLVNEAPIVDILGDSNAPTFADCLRELSTLSAQINALADSIEAGRDYR